MDYLRSIAFFSLFICLPTAMANDIFRHSEQESSLREIIKEATGQPSANTLNIAENLVGRWRSMPEAWVAGLSSGTTEASIVWKSLVFGKEGSFEAIYESRNGKGHKERVSGTYRLIQKGSRDASPGRKPNIVLRPHQAEGRGVEVMVEVDVGLDCRFPLDMVVLKFSDFEGNLHFLVSDGSFQSNQR